MKTLCSLSRGLASEVGLPQAMALVVLGGLVTITLLDLFVLPALYLRFGTSREAELGFAPMPQADLPATAAD